MIYRVLVLLAAAHAGTLSAQISDIRFGNLHAHTSYSDGSGTPDEAYAMACDEGLDFFAITEHNHIAGDGIRLTALGEYVFLRITQFTEGESGESEDDEHPEDDVVWTAPIWFETDHFHGAPEDESLVRMIAMIPDPIGDDLASERITFRNVGEATVSLDGWQVRDLAGNTWSLDALRELEPSQTKSLLRNGQSMALNNSGDRIELVAPDGSVVQLFSYEAVGAGEELTIPD